MNPLLISLYETLHFRQESRSANALNPRSLQIFDEFQDNTCLALNPNLAKYIPKVSTHRVIRDAQLLTDLLIVQAVADHLGNFHLSRRQMPYLAQILPLLCFENHISHLTT